MWDHMKPSQADPMRIMKLPQYIATEVTPAYIPADWKYISPDS